MRGWLNSKGNGGISGDASGDDSRDGSPSVLHPDDISDTDEKESRAGAFGFDIGADMSFLVIDGCFDDLLVVMRRLSEERDMAAVSMRYMVRWKLERQLLRQQ